MHYIESLANQNQLEASKEEWVNTRDYYDKIRKLYIFGSNPNLPWSTPYHKNGSLRS